MTEFGTPRNRKENVARPYGVTLATNDNLELICRIFEATRPDWTNLRREISQTVETVNGKYPGLHGKVAELHTQKFLTARAASDLFSDVCKIEDLDGIRTPNYHFKKTPDGRLYALSIVNGTFVAEYDAIALIDGLPTLFEVKARGQQRDKEQHGLNRKFNRSLKPAKLESLFPPLQEYYQTDTFGLVIVTLHETINTSGTRNQSPYQQLLRQEGGNIIAINAPLKELRDHARRIVFSHISPKSRLVYSISF